MMIQFGRNRENRHRHAAVDMMKCLYQKFHGNLLTTYYYIKIR